MSDSSSSSGSGEFASLSGASDNGCAGGVSGGGTIVPSGSVPDAASAMVVVVVAAVVVSSGDVTVDGVAGVASRLLLSDAMLSVIDDFSIDERLRLLK